MTYRNAVYGFVRTVLWEDVGLGKFCVYALPAIRRRTGFPPIRSLPGCRPRCARPKRECRRRYSGILSRKGNLHVKQNHGPKNMIRTGQKSYPGFDKTAFQCSTVV